jgi:hypothetical protein
MFTIRSVPQSHIVYVSQGSGFILSEMGKNFPLTGEVAMQKLDG